MELTPEIVESAVYEGRSYTSKGGRKRWTRHEIWDDRLPGFGLRVTSTNRKSWVVSYRDGGRKRTKVLGKVGEVSLEEARARAAELLGTDAKKGPSTRAKKKPRARAKKKSPTRAKEKPTAKGEDEPSGPAEAGDEMQGVETVAQLADLYLERHLKKNVPSWFGDQRLIRTHIVPALGRVPIGRVTRGDRSSLAVRVGQRFPADARRLRALLDGMFAWAEQLDLADKPSTKQAGGRNGPAPAERPAVEAAPEAPAAAPEEPAPPLSPDELEQALASSEKQRRQLADQLDEVSTSGVEMISQLNEQAARQRELESELTRRQRELERLRADARKAPDPGKTEKQVATLQASVGQLMDSLTSAERERDEATEELAGVQRRARKQSAQMAELRQERDALESRLREMERTGARRPAGKAGWAVWLAAGTAAGALATLLLFRVLAPAAEPPPTSSTASASQPAPAQATRLPATEPAAPRASAPAAVSPSASTPAAAQQGGGRVAGGQAATEPAPDPVLADAAVRAWARAWSEQRVDDYLAAYSSAFAPGDGTPRDEWAALRRQRILAPSSIQVGVGELSRTRLAPDRVRVSFRQSYQTESYADEVVKTLELVWERGDWRIAAERAD